MIVFLQVRIRRGEVASPSGLGNPTPTGYCAASSCLIAPCRAVVPSNLLGSLPNTPAYLLRGLLVSSFVGFRFRSTQPTILRTSNGLLTFVGARLPRPTGCETQPLRIIYSKHKKPVTPLTRGLPLIRGPGGWESLPFSSPLIFSP